MLNLLNFNAEALKSYLQRMQLVIIAVLLGLASMMPIILENNASAGSLSSRKVTISSSVGDLTGVSYAFAFTFPTALEAGGIMFEFCTTALGTCTKPTGMNVHHDTASTNASQTFSQTPVFTEVAANTGDCAFGTNGTGGTNTRYCVSRTGGTSASNETAAAKAITIDSIVNPTLSGNTTPVYVRITVYDNENFSSSGGDENQTSHNGTVAAAIVRQLTVNGRVAERLDFCVGAVTDSDAGAADSTEDASITGLTDNGICTGSFPSSSTVDIGVIDDAAINFAPVNTTATNGSNDTYGLAAVKTNASGGAAVTFFVEDATNVSGADTHHLKAFRVLPTDCDSDQTTGGGLVDQCFRSASGTGDDFTALSGATRERFGMKIACVYQGSTFSSTSNIAVNSNYDDAASASAADCENTTDNTNYAWNTTGSAVEIASSTASSGKVVDDELLKISFAATSSSTTPTGSYTVVSTYIATPTF